MALRLAVTAALRTGVAPQMRAAIRARAATVRFMQVSPRHRSDAEARIRTWEPIEVEGRLAVCDGGGGATGHPVEYIQLDRRQGRLPETCKYCGLRYIMKPHGHGHGHDSHH